MQTVMTRGRLAALAFGVGWLGSWSGTVALGGESRAKVATSSSLASSYGHIRQRAFDGTEETFFESEAHAKAGDHLTLTFGRPVALRSVAVATGRPDGGTLLDRGVLEVSEDGSKFVEAARFDPKGAARVEGDGKPVRAVRVRATADLGHALAVREFAIDSGEVAPFLHPVEFTVVCRDAPELKGWTDDVARLCESWYDALAAELAVGKDDRPAGHVVLTMRRSYRGVAEAGGGQITGSVRYFQEHPKDQGAFLHETVHILQSYNHPGNPGWLVEGVADYVRWFVFEPGKAGPVNPDKAKYDDSYRTTGAFLDYLVRKHDPQIVRELDRAMRDGTYDEAIFERRCGKPVATLGAEWIDSLRKAR